MLMLILSTLALVDSSIDVADDAIDLAQADLASLLGVSVEDPDDEVESPADDMAEMLAAPKLLIYRAKVQALALARLRAS